LSLLRLTGVTLLPEAAESCETHRSGGRETDEHPE
jgi:hypothetical protein